MKNKKIYFLGIGGIGMSAIAQYFLQNGAEVYGYDLTPSQITEMLSLKGAKIHYEPNIELIPQNVDFVVYTPAVPKNFPEYQYFATKNVPIFKRSQVLGQISDKLNTIAVAGTHGKTTTTALISHILHDNFPLAAFIGGVSKNLNDNYFCSPNPQFCVVEADEFDRSFLQLHPSVSVVTSVDADHLDIYGGTDELRAAFRQFAAQTTKSVIVEYEIDKFFADKSRKTYGTDENADYFAFNIEFSESETSFSVRTPYGTIQNVKLHAHGRYNVLNATAAIAAVCEELGWENIDVETIKAKISTFSGVKRRFDYITRRSDFVYIDDYAHHPKEINSFVEAVMNIYKNRVVCGVFQPHLYSRTRDFADDFAAVLDKLAIPILLPIYPARELPIEGVSSDFLLQKMHNPNKILLEKSQLFDYLQKNKPDVLLTIGAGDIDRLIPQLAEL